MKNNIYCTFDLSKSVSHFQEKVTKILELTSIPEWNGQTFKLREKEIRESALILAGECIALLLHNLSKSQEFLHKTMQETQGWWHNKTRKHGCKERQILEMYLVNLGISQAKQVLLIADGAEWIWIHIPPLLKKLKCPPETYQLLDFFHAASHLQGFADAAFSKNNERQQWFQKARKSLKKGQALDLMRNMGEFIFEANGERLKILVRERNYILKAYRRRLLKYNEVASRKLPLGSGAVESLIRQVVNLRMKGNSKFWLQDNAEIMLHLRCQWIAKSWDNFSDSIFNSFIKLQSA